MKSKNKVLNFSRYQQNKVLTKLWNVIINILISTKVLKCLIWVILVHDDYVEYRYAIFFLCDWVSFSFFGFLIEKIVVFLFISSLPLQIKYVVAWHELDMGSLISVHLIPPLNQIINRK